MIRGLTRFQPNSFQPSRKHIRKTLYRLAIVRIQILFPFLVPESRHSYTHLTYTITRKTSLMPYIQATSICKIHIILHINTTGIPVVLI